MLVGTVCSDNDEKKRYLPRMRGGMTMTKQAGNAIIVLRPAVSWGEGDGILGTSISISGRLVLDILVSQIPTLPSSMGLEGGGATVILQSMLSMDQKLACVLGMNSGDGDMMIGSTGLQSSPKGPVAIIIISSSCYARSIELIIITISASTRLRAQTFASQ